MTLNLFYRPTFPVNSSEEKLVSSMRIANGFVGEGIPYTNVDACGKPQCHDWEIEEYVDRRRDRVDRGGSCEPIVNEILDLLPSDPFGMNVDATFTAFKGWIEDLETDGLNYLLDQAMTFEAEPGNTWFYERSNQAGKFDGWVEEKGLEDGSCNGRFMSICNEYTWDASRRTREPAESTGSPSYESGGDPHEGLFYALGYMGIQDLLSVERVCKSMRSAVQDDPLLWKSIHINHPLSERINDDALLRITSRAQGNLRCLSLMDCARITDDGLKRVLESNPRILKLSVPGCTTLSVEGIMNNLKAFNSSADLGIKYLKLGGRYGVTNNHFEELKALLGADNCIPPKAHKPRFYHDGHSSICGDDNRAIDIEMCPKCKNLRLVYDCPAESCQGKQSATQLCKACKICIARCFQCGRCINDGEYEETFYLDLLCLDCLKLVVQCQERQEEEKGAPPAKPTIFHHQETRCHLRLCG